MSVIAYFIHVDESQLTALKEKPAIVWHIEDDRRFRSAALVDVDKGWSVLSWLGSPKKREEQSDYVARFNAIGANGGDADFETRLQREREKLGVVKPLELPTDDLLVAIEGRGNKQQREPKLNFGLNAATVFPPHQVKRLANAFSEEAAQRMRKSFNRPVMEKFMVGGIEWTNESDQVFDEFVLPAFKTLQRFYIDAARKNHYVVVFYR